MLPRIRLLYRFISALRPPFAELSGNRKWRNARRGERATRGLRLPGLPRGNELCQLLPLLDAAEINCRISAFSGYKSRVLFILCTKQILAVVYAYRFPNLEPHSEENL